MFWNKVKVVESKEYINIPLSSMSTIFKTIDKNYSDLSDYDLKTLKEYFSKSNQDLISEIDECKTQILVKT